MLPALLLHATLGAAHLCPPDICLESAIRPEPEPEVHGRRLRSIMRAFGRLRGERPRFVTTEGTPLSPKLSVATLEQRLRADGANAAFRVIYGRCASHDESCPWADVEVRVHEEPGAFECPAAAEERAMRAEVHVEVEPLTAGEPQTLDLSVGPRICAGAHDRSDEEVFVATRSAWIYVAGTHGMANAALSRLPMKTILRVLAG